MSVQSPEVLAPPSAELPPEFTPAVASDHAELDRSLVRGVVWTSAVKWGGQGFTWIATLVVARKLGPQAYGLIGMAAVYMAFVTMLSECGIGSAVVTLRQLDEEAFSQLHTVAAVLGIVSTILTAFASLLMARVFNAAHLRPIVLALSPTLLMASLQTVPLALLQRDMRFKLVAGIEGLQAIVASGSTVALALLGFGVWALVLGQILGTLVLTVALLVARPQHFTQLRLGSVREALTFGWHVLVARFAWYVYSNADMAIVGRWLGASALGAYSFGETLSAVPVQKITSLVIRVTPSVLSAAQTDRAALRRYLLLLTEAIAILTVPATIGLAIVARPFVLTVLGEKWAPAIGPLRLLAAYAAIRSVSPLMAQVLTVLGDTRFCMQTNIAAAVALPVAFLAGSHWGITGVAAAWMIVHPIVALFPIYRRTFRALGLPATTYFGALLPAIGGSVVMCLAVEGADVLLPGSMRPILRLALMIAAGALSYAATLLVTQRERLVKVRSLAVQLRTA